MVVTNIHTQLHIDTQTDRQTHRSCYTCHVEMGYIHAFSAWTKTAVESTCRHMPCTHPNPNPLTTSLLTFVLIAQAIFLLDRRQTHKLIDTTENSTYAMAIVASVRKSKNIAL